MKNQRQREENSREIEIGKQKKVRSVEQRPSNKKHFNF